MKSLRVILVALGSVLVIAAQGHSFWNDQQLADWLRSTRNSEAVLVLRADLVQAGARLPWYEMTGREEIWRQLHRRPILARGEPAGPFARSAQFVARVDRRQAASLDVGAERIRMDAAGRLVRTPVADCWLRLKPSPDTQLLRAAAGRFTAFIPAGRVCAEAEFTFRSGAERHVLRLTFLNAEQPVTFSAPAPER